MTAKKYPAGARQRGIFLHDFLKIPD